MNGLLYVRDVENIMTQAIGQVLLIMGIVFLLGVLFGWPYALAIALIIVLLVTLVGRR